MQQQTGGRITPPRKITGEDLLRCRNCGRAMGLSPLKLEFRRFVSRIPDTPNRCDYRVCPRCQTLHEFTLSPKLAE